MMMISREAALERITGWTKRPPHPLLTHQVSALASAVRRGDHLAASTAAFGLTKAAVSQGLRGAALEAVQQVTLHFQLYG